MYIYRLYRDIYYMYIHISYTKDGGDQTLNDHDSQDIQQGVPVHIKHVFTGVLKISNEFSRE